MSIYQTKKLNKKIKIKKIRFKSNKSDFFLNHDFFNPAHYQNVDNCLNYQAFGHQVICVAATGAYIHIYISVCDKIIYIDQWQLLMLMGIWMQQNKAVAQPVSNS